MASSAGNQIFITLRKGKEFPVKTVELRIKYEQTVADLKRSLSTKTGVEVTKLQLFWHGKELTPKYDTYTLLLMNLHTGFSLFGYDLTEKPDYFPPVKQTPEGLVFAAA